MTRHLFLFITIILLLAACGQGKKDPITVNPPKIINKDSADNMNLAIAFIDSIRHMEFSRDTLYLIDSVKDLEPFLEKIFRYSTVFTRDEEKFIRSAIKSPSFQIWPDKIMKKSKIIEKTAVNTVFDDDAKGWDYFHAHIGSSYTEFSIPILLRNNSVCLFYYSSHCGGICGTIRLCLYEKGPEGWKKAASFYERDI